MQDETYRLKNRMRQPLPLEYAGKSISLSAGGILLCTAAEYACAEIQRHLHGKRLKLLAPLTEEVCVDVQGRKQRRIAGDPIVHTTVPDMEEPIQDIVLEGEKDGDSLTSISYEPDNETVGVAVGPMETINACGVSQDTEKQEDALASCPKPAKRKYKRSRLGKRNDKDQK